MYFFTAMRGIYIKSPFPTSNQEIVYAFNNTSSNLDDILNMNNYYFDQIVTNIYHSELKLNKTDSSDIITFSFRF
jgi:hypothetical protein